MHKQLLITGLCCGLAFAPALAALAQTTDQTTDHQRIEALEARVAALEQRLGMTPATPPASHPQPSPTTSPTSVATPTPTAAPTPTITPGQPAPVVKTRPASSDWSQLRRGMNPREVTALLGPPEQKQVRPMSEIWFYPDDRQIEFDNGNRLQSWSKP